MSSGPQRTASDRAIWVDVCRGIAIILVVYGHALRGIYSVPMPPGPALQNSLIYAFHMPVFFVLAGLFLWPSIMKGRAHCLKTKVQTVLYPYFLWSLIAGSIRHEVFPSFQTRAPPAKQCVHLVPLERGLAVVSRGRALPFSSTLAKWGFSKRRSR